MIELFCGRLHIAWGRREWELQAKTKGGYLHWSGEPFLTKVEARRALPIWVGYGYFSDVVARNVRTGERLHPSRLIIANAWTCLTSSRATTADPWPHDDDPPDPL